MNFLVAGGFDSTGAAGVLADNRCLHHFQITPRTVLTCLAFQNHRQFHGLHVLSAQEIQNQLPQVSDEESWFCKIGALGSFEIWEAIQPFLKRHRPTLIVDPIIRTSSGGLLMKGPPLDSVREFYQNQIAPHALCMTPNYDECCFLLGYEPNEKPSRNELYSKWQNSYSCALVLTGGHDPESPDRLCHGLVENDQISTWSQKRFQNRRIRGSGCFFTTGLLYFFSQHHSLSKALQSNIEFMDKQIHRAQHIENDVYQLP